MCRLYNYGERSSVGRAPDCGSGCRGFEPHRSPHAPMLIVISGPSGVGKGTLITQLLSRNKQLSLAISATTRQPREGEHHGHDYYFLSDREFDDHISSDNFLEWCAVHHHRYGTLKSEILSKLTTYDAIIIEIDVQGAHKIRQQTKFPQCHIFIAPPSTEVLENRLKQRNTESDAIIKERLAKATHELRQQHQYDKIIINNELTQSLVELNNVIQRILTKGVSEQ